MKIKNGRNTITTDIAYIAGFFDGEGCIRIKKANQGGNSYYLWVAITNSNKAILDWISELFGGKVRKAERTVNKDIYHFLITASEANDMLKVLHGFLKEKRFQAELAIEFQYRKEHMSPKEKREYYDKISRMKKGINGNIYQNPELIKEVK